MHRVSYVYESSLFRSCHILLNDLSAIFGISRKCPQVFLKKRFISLFFVLPLKKSVSLRLNIPFCQMAQPHFSFLVTIPSFTASRRLSSSILCMSIFTGHTSVHFPHRLD